MQFPRFEKLVSSHAWSHATKLLVICITGALVQGCASVQPRPSLDTRAELETAFSAIHLTRRMHELESQIMERVDTSQIDLGPLASALLELDQGSLVAHYGMGVFYGAVEETSSAAHHENLAQEIATGVVKAGSRYAVGSPAQAEAYLRTLGYRCIGESYYLEPEQPLDFRIIAVDGAGVNHSFDFALAHPELLVPEGLNVDLSKFDDLLKLMGERIRRGDTAAISLMGTLYAQHMDDGDELDAWFERLDVGRPNITVDLLRGGVQQNMAVDRSGDERLNALKEAERHYLKAVRVGSTEAMRLLARIYASPELGPDKRTRAITLYLDATNAKNLGATRDLARLYETGDALFSTDLIEARKHYRNAFLWGGRLDLQRYTGFLRRHEGEVVFDQDILERISQSAAEEDAWSLMTLGNLYADGLGLKTNYRRARSLFRKAARQAPEAPGIVNEVAWVLSTSNQPALRDDRFALKIMDQMMSANEEARNSPMYLDTWAATYAANGDFEQAVNLQLQAIEAAEGFSSTEEEQRWLDEELATHLESFYEGRELFLELFDEGESPEEEEEDR